MKYVALHLLIKYGNSMVGKSVPKFQLSFLLEILQGSESEFCSADGNKKFRQYQILFATEFAKSMTFL